MENNSITWNSTDNKTNVFLTLNDSLTWDKIFIGCVLFLITLLTIAGNILVLVAVKMEKRLQTSFNYYIVNLAITDVAVAVTAMSFQATYTVLGFWPFGEFLCWIWIFFDYGMTFVSVFTLIVISVDRFWSVTWSVHYKQHHSKKTSIIIIISIWVFMLVLWVPPWLLDRIRNGSHDDCFWDPSLNREFVFIVASLGHHGPYFIMLFCYIRVFAFMRKRAKVADTSIPSRVPTATSSCTKRSCAYDNDMSSDAPSSKKAPKPVKQLRPDIVSVRPIKPDVNSQAFSTTHVTVSYLRVPDTYSSNGESAQLGNVSQIAREEDRQRRERRIFITLTYIIFGYAILWLPFHVLFDISILDASLVPEQAWTFGFWMAYLNSTLNPVLYNFSSPDFRKAFRKILCRRDCFMN